MRVFVLGTGRCCSKTFAMACRHFTNYIVTHESTAGIINPIEYSDNIIEVDPHLVWRLPDLVDKYEYRSNNKFIHIIREEDPCVKSLSKRSSLKKYTQFTEMVKTFDAYTSASNFYRFVNRTIYTYLKFYDVDYITIVVPAVKESWKRVYEFVKAEGDFEKSFKEWERRHNKS